MAALEDDVRNRGWLNLKDCIHHTDSDVRYSPTVYIKRLKSLEMEISMCVGISTIVEERMSNFLSTDFIF